MSIRQLVAAVLLTGGVGIALICCIGVLALDDAFDRLHFITSANTLSTGLIALAVAVGKPFSNATLKTILLLVMMIISGPILSHATARAVRIRRHGEWRILPEEVHEPRPHTNPASPERGRPDHQAVAWRLLSKIVPGRGRGENEESQG
ncbi:MAG: cation:proton antiporter [Nitriliruptorales bacterium]